MQYAPFISRAISFTCRVAAVIAFALTVLQQTDLAAAEVCLRPRHAQVVGPAQRSHHPRKPNRP